MQRRIAADVAGLAVTVAATALGIAGWAWWQATKPIRWERPLTEGHRS